MTKVAFLAGGNSVYSRLTGLIDFSTNYLGEHGIDSEVIQIHQLPSEALITADYNNDKIKEINQIVEESEVIVIATPVYKASITGILKTYLDLLPQNGLSNKIIVPLVLGGSFGHLLVIDYALKPVLSALGATNTLKGVYTVDTQITKLEGNRFELEEAVKERLINTFDEVLSQIQQPVKE
ncbi:NADPH-dependent FMN reductase [Bacillus sp. 03113]|uniref:NADPH-dependent FMN reductase n=1 Tax=Bacillus sp. 03113 TaxID=2578211 RepID=UPI001144F611|nr:NADPH-dependent FMN reductase [Bacillus sp. 03113]